MRIGYDAKRATHNLVGLGNYSRNLLQGLSEHFPENEYIAYSPGEPEDPEVCKFFHSVNLQLVTPKRVKGRIARAWWRHFTVPRLAKDQGIQVFHGLSHGLPTGLRCPTVVTFHDLIFEKHPKLFPTFDRLRYKKSYRRAAKEADLVLAVSRTTKMDLMHYYGIPESKIKITYQHVRPMFLAPMSRQTIQTTLERRRIQAPYFLSVGTLEPRKNTLGLIEAFTLLKDCRSLQLVLVGRARDGYGKKVIEAIRGHDNIHYLGPVMDAEILCLLGGALAFIYAPLVEGFGIPVLEALAARVPVITSKGISTEEITGPNAGLLADPGSTDSLVQCMEKILDPDIRANLLAAIPDAIAKFSSLNVTSRVQAAYRSLI